MVWKLGKTKKGPGMFRPVLAETPEQGIEIVMNELEGFYSPCTSNRKLRFDRAKKARGSRNPPLWTNCIYREDDNLYAKVNIQHLGSKPDANPPPAEMQQLYVIYFNVQHKNHKAALSLSMQERDDFLGYSQRQNV